MKIQVLGTGCATCQKLHQVVLKAAKELNLEKNVEYLSGTDGINKIMELGALSSPILAIDDQIVMTGFNGDVSRIKELISGQRSDRAAVAKSCSCGGKC